MGKRDLGGKVWTRIPTGAGHYFLSLGLIMASLAQNVEMAVLSRMEQSGLVRALLGREADNWSLAMPRPIFQHSPHLNSFSLLNHSPSLSQPRNGSDAVAAEGKKQNMQM